MGPLRGKLIAAPLLLTPGAAWAEICATARPGWEPGTPVTGLDEAVYLFTSGPGLFLLAATAVALVLRNQWGGLVAVLLWTGLITFVTMGDSASAPGRAEGCIGSPALFIGLVAAISVATVLYTMPHKSGD